MHLEVLAVIVTVLLVPCFMAWAIVRLTQKSKDDSCAKLMIVLGSGGHTAEMLTLVGQLDKKRYSPRTYIVAETDQMGAQKALTSEGLDPSTPGGGADNGVKVCTIPRSREVGQSYITSVVTTLIAMLAAFMIVLKENPDLVLVNGPGTCIPICVAAFFFRLVGLGRAKIVYVESIARTCSLSLSGKLLYHLRIADRFFVQWPSLQHRFPRSIYSGRLY
eukprot:jgi/Botrbrau1/5832/Bobra.0366s0014.1